jgi:archaemetzincin
MHIHIFWDRAAPEGLQVPVARTISSLLDVPADVIESPVRIKGYNSERKQYDAQMVLDSITSYTHHHGMREPILLVISQDLFRPGHRYLFGLARPQHCAAVISSARLTNEFYGRPGNDDDLIDRLSKEGTHEAGHLFGLEHCTNPECIMFRPDTLDELDGKKKMFCPLCREVLQQNLRSG